MERYRYLSEEKVDRETGCTYTYIDGQNWTPNLHDHDYYEIFLVLDNSVVHYVNGVYQELCRGTLVFIRPKDLHTFAKLVEDKERLVVRVLPSIESISLCEQAGIDCTVV